MKTKFNGILTLILVLLVQISFAQEKTISGTVTDESGPLPGVNVIIKGTNNGTQTDFDGKYSIKAKSGDIIVFSYVGMTAVEKTVGSGSIIDAKLEGSNLLEEVVIVGYGTSTKQSFTGTIKTVKAEDLEIKSVSNVSQALAGEVSGVQVINTSGQPGTASTIRIRGFGSVNGNRDPLYVVDGIPFSGSINSINPADIESTSVLKDATATAIYGSRGANGVILINTKRGKSNSSAIEVDVKTGINVSLLPRYSTIKSPEEYIALSWEALYNKGVATGEANPTDYANNTLFSGGGIDPKYNLWNVDGANLINPLTGAVNDNVTRKYDPENWEDYGFQDSFRTEANLKMSGGSDKTRYFSSFGYLEDVGYIINSDYKRYTTRINLSHEVKPWLTGSVNLGYAMSETNNNGQSSDSGSIFWFVDNIPSIFPLFSRDASGNFIPETIYGGNEYDYGVGRAFGALTNSIADAHYDRSRAKRHELNGNFSFNIKFSDKFTFENSFGAQYYNNKYNSLNNPFYGSAAGQGGSVYKSDTELLAYNFLNLLRYKNNFNDHSVEVLVAHESNAWEQKRFTASMEKMVHPDIDDLNNFVIVSSPPRSWTDESSLESYFGQVNYNFQEKYFLTGSVRRDGSSRFIGDNKWDTFGSVGASWILSKENFMTQYSLIEFLKFKLSYGLVGEQAGVGYYPGYTTYNVNNLNDEISISENQIGNPDLTWETSKQFQTGLEFSLGKYVDAGIDYYIKDTDNLLFDRRVGPSVGYALQTVNDGQLRNSGLEFDITTHILKKEDYSLDFTINGELLKNELTQMPIDPATGEPKLLDISGLYGRSTGHSLYDFYTREWAGVDPADGTGMWFVYYNDANTNGVVDSGERISSLTEYMDANPDNVISKSTTKTYSDATQKYIGKSAIPKIRGAFRLSATFKDFDISSQFIYSLGGYAYDGAYAGLMHNRTIGNNNWSTDIYDRWQQPGDITNVPRLSSNYDTNVNSSSTRFISKSDFLSLNNVKIGYTIPKAFVEKAGLSSLNISLSGDNLFFLSERDGFNPSTAETGGSDTYRYSPLSTFTLGVRAKF
ncbi:SusC/RagA family TonB-linked outer membrane protein [Lutibacter sp.]|uniref:SusC/RagA family TonB-linked outer membrane protein n=1 Tax=Lutibacter sp. TaxID=1925666 RepID=UPI001A33F464|nr:SusC/RagA family TonB-linked outer membrane protein [Lutibacter sp.]MBI9040617.1 SusC/RagA family TonB-linked outer membrane protein [Lutibacter sp.]